MKDHQARHVGATIDLDFAARIQRELERGASMAFRKRFAGVILGIVAGLGCVSGVQAQTRMLGVVGTGDGIDLLRAVAASFNEQDKAVRIEIPASIGSGGGIAAVGSGKAILGRVARKLTDAETASGMVYKPIARLPSAFFIHPGIGISGITSEQLLAIYAGKTTNWKELGGADQRIRVVRREDTDSTLTVLRSSMPGWSNLEITDKSKTATSTQEAVETVREVTGAIGFGPYSKPLGEGLTVLRIDGRHPTDFDYPSSVVLALIHMSNLADPDALAFVKFVESAQAQGIITSLGSVPVKPREAAAAQ
jgi:phosphate transport system substrate-binding protein